MAYADPPYPGCAKRHYGPDAQEVNYKVLIQGLDENFDGWAVSCGSGHLKRVLAVCPDDIRIGSWVKPYSFSLHPGYRPPYNWEPVVFKQGRKNQHQYWFRDFIIANLPVLKDQNRKAVHGRKPVEFCYWVFKFLGLKPDDEFIDLFPGSGAVTRAWNAFRSQRRLPE